MKCIKMPKYWDSGQSCSYARECPKPLRPWYEEKVLTSWFFSLSLSTPHQLRPTKLMLKNGPTQDLLFQRREDLKQIIGCSGWNGGHWWSYWNWFQYSQKIFYPSWKHDQIFNRVLPSLFVFHYSFFVVYFEKWKIGDVNLSWVMTFPPMSWNVTGFN